jgi:hypothetical protein
VRPVISSHNGTGGTWTPAELARLYRLGGFAAVTPAQAPALAAKIIAMSTFHFAGVGIGTDTGGFASLPAPLKTATLRYPFTSYDGRVTFARERTGTRTFDLNRDGVAHYGLCIHASMSVVFIPERRSAPSLARNRLSF